ncbi:MAG TPA: hypothetical protein DEQ43_24565 [Nocardioides bacterium]|uniref:hypothetical protein n=1 Tax=uncultured Nocardioides sp. TaxID=198441 RepID=UPI000ECBDA6E|nr:hypothetical protein [uncultured Nocardioides sp.]HCB07384.1 hypothetical protein [Nocardioides sp.]HRD63215.1 hypothetical protein [Nocardioides sp.]
MTTVTTQNPVRSDLASTESGHADRTTHSRLWAVAGVGAALAGMATIVTSSAIDIVYRDEFAGTTDGVAQALSDKSPVLFVFHTATALGAVLMIVFGAGLFRRLRATTGDSLAPVVALVGLAGTAVVSILGSGLDTEFMMPGPDSEPGYADSSAALYNHWIGTIPWLWTLAGLAGLAIFAAARARAVPRWLGLVGLVLGGLTVLLGVSPLEYMAGITGVLWLLVTALGFTFGDKAYRASR